MPRIGVLGGTFDPIHLGHLRAAIEARETLDLDEVCFVPAAVPPHKLDREVSPASHRVRMVELALEGEPGFRLSTVEIEREGPSYSVDTIEALGRDRPEATLVFLVGHDAFLEMDTWRDVVRLFSLADVAVLRRPPAPIERSIEHLPFAARQAFRYVPTSQSYRHESGHVLCFAPITSLDVSATDVRRRIGCGKSIRFLVPRAVERYIAENTLFRLEDV